MAELVKGEIDYLSNNRHKDSILGLVKKNILNKDDKPSPHICL